MGSSVGTVPTSSSVGIAWPLQNQWSDQTPQLSAKAGHCVCCAGFIPSRMQALVMFLLDCSSESSVWSLGASLDLRLLH